MNVACASDSASIRLSATCAAAAWFQGLEPVADRTTMEPFDPAHKLHTRVRHEAMARGVVVYPMGGTVDGDRGDDVLLAPPLIIDNAAIETIIKSLGHAIDAAVAT